MNMREESMNIKEEVKKIIMQKIKKMSFMHDNTKVKSERKIISLDRINEKYDNTDRKSTRLNSSHRL